MRNLSVSTDHCSFEQSARCHLIWNIPRHNIPIFSILEYNQNDMWAQKTLNIPAQKQFNVKWSFKIIQGHVSK